RQFSWLPSRAVGVNSPARPRHLRRPLGETMSAALPFKLVSADSHIVEPPDLWTKHIDRRFLDRAPRFVRGGPEEGDGFVCEGLLRGQKAGVGLVSTKRKYANPEVYDFGGPGQWEEVPEASWDPD